MKAPLLIEKTPGGKRLRQLEPAELDHMIQDGAVEHFRGNVYQTKVMHADTQRAVVEHRETISIAPPQPKKRGRPRKDGR